MEGLRAEVGRVEGQVRDIQRENAEFGMQLRGLATQTAVMEEAVEALQDQQALETEAAIRRAGHNQQRSALLEQGLTVTLYFVGAGLTLYTAYQVALQKLKGR